MSNLPPPPPKAGGTAPRSSLDTPQRQSPIAIIAALLDVSTLREIAQTLIPVIAVALTTRGRILVYLAPIAVAIALGMVVLRWWRTTFWVEHGDLVFEKGLFNRSRLQVPLDRIQQISTEQGIVQQIFGVRGVVVVTAGSAASELSLMAVSDTVVSELRDLLVGPSAVSSGSTGAVSVSASPGSGPPHPGSEWDSTSAVGPFPVMPPVADRPFGGRGDIALRFEMGDLVRLGLIRPGGQVLGGVLALVGLGLGGVFGALIEDQVTGTVSFVAFVMITVVFLTVALIGGAVLRDYELTVWRSDEGLRLTAGLLNKREQFARVERVQLVRQRANVLERLLGRTSLAFPQASAVVAAEGAASGSGQLFAVPGVANDVVDGLTLLFLPERPPAADRSISPAAVWRWTRWGAIAPAGAILAGSGFAAATGTPWFVVAALVVVAGVWAVAGSALARATHARWGWGMDGQAINVVNGVIIAQRTVVAIRKIQSVRMRQNWWQRRHRLASLWCGTAGGSFTIPHLPLDEARRVRDEILLTIETSQGPWM